MRGVRGPARSGFPEEVTVARALAPHENDRGMCLAPSRPHMHTRTQRCRRDFRRTSARIRRNVGALGLLAFLSLSAPGARGASAYCWSDFPSNQYLEFDFALTGSVSGMLPGGGYRYTYTLYRIDHGPRRSYRDLSHFSLRFPCGAPAVSGIRGAAGGITFDGPLGAAAIEISDPTGLNEPGLAANCGKFFG